MHYYCTLHWLLGEHRIFIMMIKCILIYKQYVCGFVESFQNMITSLSNLLPSASARQLPQLNCPFCSFPAASCESVRSAFNFLPVRIYLSICCWLHRFQYWIEMAHRLPLVSHHLFMFLVKLSGLWFEVNQYVSLFWSNRMHNFIEDYYEKVWTSVCW